MPRTRSFQRRIFITVLVVALLPVGLTMIAGSMALREMVAAAGTAGPWESVSRSGRVLLEEVEALADPEPSLEAAAREHREALSESARLSRIYTFLSERFLRVFPLLVLGVGVLIVILSTIAARRLSLALSRPTEDLVAWAGRIARSEPLPPPSSREAAEPVEFRRLRSALREMAEELEAARRREAESVRLRTWTSMARGIAHDLKNPLTPMRMAATALSRSGDAGVRESADVLLEEIARLDDMARSFARLGRAPEGPPSEVDVEELLGGLVRQHDRPEVPVRLEVEGTLPLVRGHVEPLRRAVGNLLANAVEAVGAEGEVEVVAAPAPGGVEVIVRDTGPGIPAELLGAIWEPEVTTKRRGTGLGLALVRQTIRFHGGDAEARNRPGGGAEFRILLPREGPPASVPPNSDRPGSGHGAPPLAPDDTSSGART